MMLQFVVLKPSSGGHGQCCENGKKNQGFQLDGFLAEYAVVDWRFTVKIPDGLPLAKYAHSCTATYPH